MTTAPVVPHGRPASLREHSPIPAWQPGSQDSYNARFERVAMLATVIELRRIRTRRRLVAGLMLIGIGAAAVAFALVW